MRFTNATHHNNTGSSMVMKKVTAPYFVIHNETFSGVGITEDVVAPLWTGVLVGVVLMGVCSVCIVLVCSYRQRRATHPTYEGLPLITARTMRR